ncbi:MAG: hypothetical protein JO126_00945 [Alphaproteobacteria bacterium]|nr:hypothetical protein [Alphaproteobacteria bacterium]
MGALSEAAQPLTPPEASELRDLFYSIESLSALGNGQTRHIANFTLDGLKIQITQTHTAEESLISVVAFIGYLPFSIQSMERRFAVLRIISDISAKLFVKFELDNAGRVFARGTYIKDVNNAPDFIFYPLIMFLQESRPFINLLGEYVST